MGTGHCRSGAAGAAGHCHSRVGAVAVYAGAAEKKISLNSYVNGLLDSMITISDNESYNELVRTVGQGSFA